MRVWGDWETDEVGYYTHRQGSLRADRSTADAVMRRRSHIARSLAVMLVLSVARREAPPDSLSDSSVTAPD